MSHKIILCVSSCARGNLLDDLLNFDTYSNLKFNLNLPKVDGESKEDERR